MLSTDIATIQQGQAKLHIHRRTLMRTMNMSVNAYIQTEMCTQSFLKSLKLCFVGYILHIDCETKWKWCLPCGSIWMHTWAVHAGKNLFQGFSSGICVWKGSLPYQWPVAFSIALRAQLLCLKDQVFLSCLIFRPPMSVPTVSKKPKLKIR